MPSSIPSSRQVSIERGDARPRRRRLAVAAALLLVAGTVTGGQAANAAPKPAAPTGLGPNVIV
ncbi:MAG TPA: hypothetical protein VIG76_00535, partial [Amnibacterium sp.]|uniref:hypothetical protein n=1 Tax=Amnibacterium sp. TaxID=1872496 RepID=UPI002F92BA0F